jgi:heme exporter protein D
MTMVEYFSFLPYGKYAFYVWLAYGVATLTVIFLFIVARKNHSSTLNSLKNKYSRGND